MAEDIDPVLYGGDPVMRGDRVRDLINWACFAPPFVTPTVDAGDRTIDPMGLAGPTVVLLDRTFRDFGEAVKFNRLRDATTELLAELVANRIRQFLIRGIFSSTSIVLGTELDPTNQQGPLIQITGCRMPRGRLARRHGAGSYFAERQQQPEVP